MTNKYLVKLAGRGSVKKYLGYVSGSTARDAAKRVKYVEDAIRTKSGPEALKRRHAHAQKETTKARVSTAGVAAGVGAVGAGAYVNKKRRQNQADRDDMAQFYKSAGAAAAAKTLGSAGVSGVGKILKRIGHRVGDTLTTASGGKIKDYAVRHGIGTKTPGFKAYNNAADKHGKVKTIMEHRMKTDKSINKQNYNEHRLNHTRDIGALEDQRTHARIALGATTVAGVSAYGAHKAKQALKEKESYYR